MITTFDQFWDVYPRKRGKGAAQKAWQKLNPDAAVCRMITFGLAWQVKEWESKDPQFIPHPATWLNQRRWEDAPEQPAAPQPSAKVRGIAAWLDEKRNRP